jgi:predicted CopG family antitoxin
MPFTTIQIDIEVRDQLRARGRMGESYNDVIRRLLVSTKQLEPPGRALGAIPPVAGSRPWVPFRDRD